MKIKRALISVSDKTGLEELVKALHASGVEILSTGGTGRTIRSYGIPVVDVSEYTGFPEMLDGRVKTLHPKIHGGLLSLRDNKEHMDTVEKNGIGLIDMVVVNLYQFEKIISNPDVTVEEAIENIDIGGPSMLRSAAKNYKSVCVVCDTDDYKRVIEDMQKHHGSVSSALMAELGIKAFGRTAVYDRAIYNYLREKVETGDKSSSCGNDFPDVLTLKYRKIQDLRYGENPHQRAAFYRDEEVDEPSIASATQLHGKELSFNNIIDLDAALELVKEFENPAAAIIKHTNPCGVAMESTLEKAYVDALDCDRMSAFGSIVGFNRQVTAKLAHVILEEADFVECMIAPSYDPQALEILKKAKKNLRILEVKNFGIPVYHPDCHCRKVVGGMLKQDRDRMHFSDLEIKVATKLKPTKDQLFSLLFGWLVAKHVRSNAIVLCQGMKTVGVGAGQMSRVDAVMLATRKAGERSSGACLASDAFFPKEDGVEQAALAGVKAIIQPGGSIRDKEVIETADRLGVPMVFTGVRHFRH